MGELYVALRETLAIRVRTISASISSVLFELKIAVDHAIFFKVFIGYFIRVPSVQIMIGNGDYITSKSNIGDWLINSVEALL